MRIAVEGCAHGDLDNIYAAMREVEANEGVPIDLLICCGDFQVRGVDLLGSAGSAASAAAIPALTVLMVSHPGPAR